VAELATASRVRFRRRRWGKDASLDSKFYEPCAEASQGLGGPADRLHASMHVGCRDTRGRPGAAVREEVVQQGLQAIDGVCEP